MAIHAGASGAPDLLAQLRSVDVPREHVASEGVIPITFHGTFVPAGR